MTIDSQCFCRLFALAALAMPGVVFAQLVQPAPRVVAPDRLDKFWVMDKSSIEASVPNFGSNMSAPTCATVSFVVERDGTTSTVKVQKIVPEGSLRQVALSAATSARFVPTRMNAGRGRVFSWLIFPFNLPADPAARTAVMQPCAIEMLGWADR